MSLVGSNALAGASGQAAGGGYEIERSLRFNSEDSAHLSRTFSSAGNQKKWTWSGWVKRSSGGSKHHLFAIHTANNDSGYFRLAFNNDNKLFAGLWSKSILTTNAVFRDFSAWMHVVLVLDTANSTAADRIILYVNGVRQSVTGSADDDTAYAINSAGLHNIGSQTNTSQYFDGYLAEIHFLDGIAASASDFGKPDDNGVWQPKEYSGSYGTNGFHLDFSDNSSTGALGDNRLSLDYSKLGGALTTTTGSGSFYSNTNPNRAFDGNTSNVVYGGWAQTGDDSNLIWSPPSGSYSVSSSLRVYAGYYTTIYVNGVSKATNNANNGAAWVTLAHTGAINEIKIENTTNDNVARISAIEIDGTVLVSKAWTVNNLTAGGVDYASQAVLTGSIYSGAGDKTKMFDGTNATAGPGMGSYIDFTPSSAITINSTLRIKANVSNASEDAIFQINNSNVSTVSTGFPANTGVVNAATTYTTISNPPSSLSHLRFGWDSSASWMSLAAIEIDGVELVGVSGDEIDSLRDSPSNGDPSGNYATWNPLIAQTSGSGVALSNGNLDAAHDSSDAWASTGSTLAAKSGKYYAEFTVTGTLSNVMIGLSEEFGHGSNFISHSTMGDGFCIQGDTTIRNRTFTKAASTTSQGNWSAGDVISIAIDLDAGKAWTAKNGSWDFSTVSGNAFDSSNPTATWTDLTKYYLFAVSNYSDDNTVSANFGQRTFAYTAPSGFKALRTNLLDQTIEDPSKYFDTILWTGQGNTNDRVLTTTTSADFVWTKSRSHDYHNALFDTVRGFSQNGLNSNSTNNEGQATGGYLKATTDTSITLAATSDTSNAWYNGNNHTYVGWLWDAGTGSPVSNTDGSITSSVKASQSAGFSIVSYSGALSGAGSSSIGHGLGAVPSLILVKNRDTTDNWVVYNQYVGNAAYLMLNSANSPATGSSMWGNTTPTSTTFTAGFASQANQSGHDYIAYCFTPVEGYSSIGKYSGNGDPDGPFVYTGFRVAWLMVKNVDTSGEPWTIYDSTRDPYNLATHRLRPDSYGGEESGTAARDKDLLSNGFKVRGTSGEQNTDGDDYIYLAFAENPFKTARAR